MPAAAAASSAAREDVLVRRENGILVVTINRPDQRNAVNAAVSSGIASALDLLDASPDLRVDATEGVTAFRDHRAPVWQDR